MYSNNRKKTSHTRMPEELKLIGMPITGDSDLFRLRKFINANRHEHDPKEMIENGMPRHGAGWDPLAQCAFGNWEMKARLSGCDVFELSGRISFVKLSAYMLTMLPEVIDFIDTGDRLVALYRLHIILRLFFPNGNLPKGNPLLDILSTMKQGGRRGQTSSGGFSPKAGTMDSLPKKRLHRSGVLLTTGGCKFILGSQDSQIRMSNNQAAAKCNDSV